MAKLHFVKKARKAIRKDGKVYIKKGESYYWWKFYRSSKQVSKDKPRRSQLTQSSYYSIIFDMEDDLAQGKYFGLGLGDLVSQVRDELQELYEECNASYDNIPEQLQEVGTGEMLGNQLTALEEAENALSNLFDQLDSGSCEDDDEENPELTRDEVYDQISDILSNLQID